MQNVPAQISVIQLAYSKPGAGGLGLDRDQYLASRCHATSHCAVYSRFYNHQYLSTAAGTCQDVVVQQNQVVIRYDA